MLDTTKLKVGDIVKYRPLEFKWNRILDWLGDIIITSVTGDNFNHASMITQIWGGVVFITETHAATGCVEKALNEKWYPYIQIVRPMFSEKSAQAAANWWKLKVGTKYDMRACILTGIRGVFNLWRRDKLILDTENEFYCSNGIALAYMETCQKAISAVNPSQCTPSDINRNGKYGTIVWDGKNV